MKTKYGWRQKELVFFLAKYPKEWHTYSKDALTSRIVKSLEKNGVLETNEYNQMRLV